MSKKGTSKKRGHAKVIDQGFAVRNSNDDDDNAHLLLVSYVAPASQSLLLASTSPSALKKRLRLHRSQAM